MRVYSFETEFEVVARPAHPHDRVCRGQQVAVPFADHGPQLVDLVVRGRDGARLDPPHVRDRELSKDLVRVLDLDQLDRVWVTTSSADDDVRTSVVHSTSL